MAKSDSIFSERMPPAVSRGDALPWPLIGCAIAAMAALYFSADRFIGLPIMAALMVFSRFTAWRLPKNFLISYGSRGLILIITLSLINQTDPQDATPWYLKQADTNLAGYALAADLVLRAWSRRDAAGAREGLGVVILITALLFAAASDTYDRLHIQLITPIYVILLLISLRSFSMMNQPAKSPRAMRPGLISLRAFIILFTLALSFSAVYFVTRFEYQVVNWAMRFTRNHPGQQHEIGFSISPQLSTVFNPEPSSSRVLIIDGELSDPHLRIAAFDTYQSPAWLPSISDRNFSYMAGTSPAPSPKLHPLHIARLGDTADLLPAPLTAAAINSTDPLEEDQSGTVRDNRSGSMQAYSAVDSSTPTFQGALAIAPDAKSRARLLAIPAQIDPRVIALARQVAGSGEPARQIFRIQEYLRGHHAYSLSFTPQGEPLNDFLLNDRAAHCQYFASAVVIMARAIGVPARFVGGFYAHEPYGNDELVVRQRDSHAWAECWIDRIGWVTVDATPAGGRPDQTYADPPAWKRWWEKLTDLPAEIRQWMSDNSALLKQLAAVGAVIALCVWIVRKILEMRRRPRPTAAPGYAAPDEQLIEMAKRFDHWMNRRGNACPPQSTWRAHLEKREQLPAADCAIFVRTYDRARFGNRADDIKNAREILNRIEQSD